MKEEDEENKVSGVNMTNSMNPIEEVDAELAATFKQ